MARRDPGRGDDEGSDRGGEPELAAPGVDVEDRFVDGASFAAFADGLVGAQAGTTPFYVAVYDMLDGDEAGARRRAGPRPAGQ